MDLITFISEYNRLKMISIHEPLENLKKLSERHADEVGIASLLDRIKISGFDEEIFNQAIAQSNFDLDEKLVTEVGFEISMKELLKIISLEIGKNVAEYFSKEVEKI
ncbi:MAG: hypothetical protein ACN6OJ_09660 [Chryseobacterium sp.]|uniref:hypothetical protein n=1 Tax=Chryseobacterium sp. TaxID=1871047 RepID=UPI003D12D20B